MTSFSMTNGVVNLLTNQGKVGLQGLCSEFALPAIEFKVDDEQRLGFFGTIPIVMGLEPLEGSMTIKGWNKDWLIASLNWMTGFSFQVVGSLTPLTRAGLVLPTTVLYYVSAIPSKIETGNLTAGENTESEIEYLAHSVRISHNNIELFNLDVPNNVYEVNGVDLLAQFRTNLA
jgi:uncharacterized protein